MLRNKSFNSLNYLIYTNLVIISLTVVRVNGTYKKNPFLPPAPAQPQQPVYYHPEPVPAPVYYHPAPAPAPVYHPAPEPPPQPRHPPPQIYIVPVKTYPAHPPPPPHPPPRPHPPPHPAPPPPPPVHPAPQPVYTHPSPQQPKVIQPTFVIQPIIVKPVPVGTGSGGGGGKGGKGCKHCHG